MQIGELGKPRATAFDGETMRCAPIGASQVLHLFSILDQKFGVVQGPVAVEAKRTEANRHYGSGMSPSSNSDARCAPAAAYARQPRATTIDFLRLAGQANVAETGGNPPEVTSGESTS